MEIIKHIIKLVLILPLVVACDNLVFQEPEPDVSVIESYIAPGNTATLKISKQIIFKNGDTTIHYLDNLLPIISNNGVDYIFEYDGDSLYINTDLIIAENGEYSLEYYYNNKTVTSKTTVPTKPSGFTSSANTMAIAQMGGGSPPGEMPDPIELTWDNEFNEYHMAVIENTEDEPTQINTLNDRPPRVFRNSPTQNNSQNLDRMNFSYYGNHMIILYKLNPEYAALYEQMGNSSLDIAAPPSNIENGLGIFTGINSDTLFITITK